MKDWTIRNEESQFIEINAHRLSYLGVHHDQYDGKARYISLFYLFLNVRPSVIPSVNLINN